MKKQNNRKQEWKTPSLLELSFKKTLGGAPTGMIEVSGYGSQS